MPNDYQMRRVIKGYLRPMKYPNLAWKRIVEAGRDLSQSELARAAEKAVKTAILDERDRLTTKDVVGDIDLSRRLQAAPFTSTGLNQIGAGTSRSREKHGEKLRGELAAPYRAFDAARREDPRLDPPQGAFLEVELKRGSRVQVVERKNTGIKPGAARLETNDNRIVGLYVPDESREVFAEILREYQEGELTPRGKPQRRTFVEPIESIREARLETFWTDDPSRLPPPGRQM